MSQLLFYYQRPEPATWVFVSSFLLFSFYFVFHRFFCVRNLDLVLLLLLAPGLMMVYEGRRQQMSDALEVSTGSLARPSQPTASGTARGRSMAMSKSDESSRENSASPSVRSSRVQLVAKTTSGALQTQTPAQPSELETDTGSSESAAQAAPQNAYPTPRTQTLSRWKPEDLEFYGFVAVLIACFFLLIRMLVDPALVRRPLLVPNLSIGGMSFIGVCMFLFLMGNVVTSTPEEQKERGPALGPGYVLLNMLPELPTTPDPDDASWDADASSPETATWLPNLTRIVSILSNLVIVAGIVGVGYWHFDNVKTGIGCATMYLMLPYTAQMTGNAEHTVPAAFLVTALLAYRQPLVAGVLLGAAAGLVYYPLFLLPLWFSFYWYRGLSKFLIGVLGSLGVLVILLVFEGSAFADNFYAMFGLWSPRMNGLEGIWATDNGLAAEFRLPILVACILLSASFVFWPPRKTLATLMCGTAAIMLAVQFWHGFGGGLFMAWFLPLTLLTIFRPNLDDRVATNVVTGIPPRAPAAT